MGYARGRGDRISKSSVRYTNLASPCKVAMEYRLTHPHGLPCLLDGALKRNNRSTFANQQLMCNSQLLETIFRFSYFDSNRMHLE